MLIRFAVANYRSIDELQELSMVPSAYLKERAELLLNCEAVPGGKLLPAAIIYGPNASGKSNVLLAARFLRSALQFSYEVRPGVGVPRRPFVLKKSSAHKPTVLELEFVAEGTRHQYGFEANDTEFTAEWLYSYPRGRRQMMFERKKNQKIKFGRTLRGENKVISRLMKPNSLFVSTAAQAGHQQLSKIRAYAESLKIETLVSPGSRTVFRFLKKREIDPRIIQFLQQIGTGVIGYKKKPARKDHAPQNFSEELKALISRHVDGIDLSELEGDVEFELAHQGDSETPVYFEFSRESRGTRRLLLVLAYVFDALDSGSVLFLDELDASLHTQVGDGILALFASPKINSKGAQLIATTHDTNHLVSTQLRRDQIWFTEKDVHGATHLYPLSDIKTRKTDNLEKGYLQGRFGAVPFAGSLVDLLGAA